MVGSVALARHGGASQGELFSGHSVLEVLAAERVGAMSSHCWLMREGGNSL